MSVVFLGLGSNVDAHANIRSGIRALESEFGEVTLSPVYRTAAVGFEGDDFLNLAARIETTRGPVELKQFLSRLENAHGRARDVPKFSDRTLDIDILLYDDLHLESPAVQIPRDEILEAAHVLRPLADLAPGLRHPTARRTMAELWSAYPQRETRLEPVEL